MLLSPTANEKSSISCLELVHAIGSLRELFSDGTIERLQPTGPAAIYTSSVTLWMLISQRLAGGKSMAATVTDFIADRPTFCPDNRRLDKQTLSSKSSADAGARKRLGLPTAKHLFDRVVESITHPKVAFGVRPRQMFILDGTTITLSPTEQLRSEFPPATNQHRESLVSVEILNPFNYQEFAERKAVDLNLFTQPFAFPGYAPAAPSFSDGRQGQRTRD